MSKPCHHGQSASHRHHHHGVAEGVSPVYVHKLRIALGLGALYFVAQVLGAYFSGSLALLADAGHKLADILAMALALGASWFASLATSPRKTFGYHRLEILAAFLNGLSLFFIALFILWEAGERFLSGTSVAVEGGIMLGVSLVGLLINIVSAVLLYPSRDMNLNVKGALFHLMADIADSVGTFLTALGVLFFHITWLDTLLSAVIATLVMFNAIRLFREAFNILMESAPAHLPLQTIRQYILERPAVLGVHDIHIWTVTTGKDALLAHVQVAQENFNQETVRRLEHDLRERFDLCHLTIQLEPPGFTEAPIPF
jgi:cobalt-zinc-cadmium efflux system protein